MNRVLVVAEHADGRLNAAVAKCVACARTIPDSEITVAVLAKDGGEVAAAAAALEGVARVLLVANPSNEPALAAVLAPQVAKLAEGHAFVLGPSTTFGKDLMPRVAALLDAPQVSDVMAFESATRLRRPMYAANAIATVELPAGRSVVATVRVASFQAVPAGGKAPVEPVTLDVKLPASTRFVSVTAARGDRPDLQTAARVVSGGRALGSAENFKLIQGLADKLGAAIGASRAAVDAGYAPNELQVGQTGKIIAPELYVAVGISGAIQHLTGIKDARTIVAINKDPEAPIFEVADYGLVGDLFSLLPEIEKLL
ncbi:MAG TPA: electron transfer flavoprotein subunit alpha/FixB family protein [Steroidobacteraceae bacterium]|jgi:electron transfer flavoprotein alpha subunit|nr:electron transfer flavoprotein subunit alpha/FixB family protein [Steroidobacteraceae bacterium]